MIQLQNLSKSYPHQELFNSIGFSVHKNEKIGLVGRNGTGKTTLLRMISGEETADSGTVSAPKDYQIGYLKQHLSFDQDNLIEECKSALPPELIHDTWKIEKTLSGLGFSEDQYGISPNQLSGGYQVRLNLAKLLLSEPDMMLLDEPTNYLDIISIRWLKNFLRSYSGELIIVTHDRGFMDEVCTHIVSIHRKKVRKMKGNTEKMYLQIAKEEEIYEKTRMNDEKERQRVENFIDRFRAKARLAGMVQSRIKTLSKLEKKDALAELKDLEFSFNYCPMPGKWIMEINDLNFQYNAESPLLIDGLDIAIGKNDRIAIIGPNGKGKTTLLRLISGDLNPSAGEIKPHPKIQPGYFGQTNRETLTPHLTVEEEIFKSLPGATSQTARSIAGAMLFEGEMSQKKVSVLSGGEKARVALAKIIASPSNILLLDEPTNHLDMQANDALLQAMDAYEGAVLIVTHNEMILRHFPDRLIVFDGGKVFTFEGGYDEFLSEIGWVEESGNNLSASKQNSSVNKKDLRKMRAEIIDERSKSLNPLKTKIDQLESEITRYDKEQKQINDDLIAATQTGESHKIADLSIRLNEVNGIIDNLFDELESVTGDFEKLSTEYDNRLKEI